MRPPAALSVVLAVSLLFTLSCPGSSWGFLDFSEDALKSTGIIIGITAGVVLLVVLVAGTIKDIKAKKGEEEDIWAGVRDNPTLAHFPELLLAPALLEEMKLATASSPPPDLPPPPPCMEGGPASVVKLNPALYQVGVSGALRACAPASSTGRPPEGPPPDAGRFASLSPHAAAPACVP